MTNFAPEMTIIDLPSFRADPARHGTLGETVIAIDLTRMIVLIGGTAYAGEMKKAVFTALNFLLPAKGVMPMHCSANVGPARRRRGVLRPVGHRQDDAVGRPGAHARSATTSMAGAPAGIFNFEGGCYAKTIRLSAEAEPEIFATTRRFGTVLENVVLDADARAGFQRRQPDRKHALRLPARFHRQCQPDRAGGPSAATSSC